MESTPGKLVILNTVDSTNNYAMARLHEGLAVHGDAWFANEQTAGKGRLDKAWAAEPQSNVLMSIAIKPSVRVDQQFEISAAAAVATHKLLTKYIEGLKIKWPNDIYWRDRKAAGILIENIISGHTWRWSVVGIGLNVNQVEFDSSLPNPVSLKQISGKTYNVYVIAEEVRKQIAIECSKLSDGGFEKVLKYYNEHLYKRGEVVNLKSSNARFTTTIEQVSADGLLIVNDIMMRSFRFDEVKWEL